MTPELTVLALAALLQAIQFSFYSPIAQKQHGSKYAMGPRDEPRPVTGMAGRLQRTMNNHFEGLILFTIAAMVIHSSGQSSAFTTGCAWTYLAMRVLYLPAYAFGWYPWRTVIWTIGFLATLAMIFAALI